MSQCVFIAGGTGWVGRRLIGKMLSDGHAVRALVRGGSEKKLPGGCIAVQGDALDASTFRHAVSPADTYVHLVGTKPSPWKEREFRAVDQRSLMQALDAAKGSGIRHFVYVSVAHPAPVMKAYIRVRMECEQAIRESGLTATILRPWYVLGPGRRWPLLLTPFYKLGEALGWAGAKRLGLLTEDEMIAAMGWAVNHPGGRVLDVPAIRSLSIKTLPHFDDQRA